MPSEIEVKRFETPDQLLDMKDRGRISIVRMADGIRHVEAWFISKGGKVPDESTLKRRLRNIWTKFGPEGAQNEP
jgi:hypothetical protein